MSAAGSCNRRETRCCRAVLQGCLLQTLCECDRGFRHRVTECLQHSALGLVTHDGPLTALRVGGGRTI